MWDYVQGLSEIAEADRQEASNIQLRSLRAQRSLPKVNIHGPIYQRESTYRVPSILTP
jgi:hypothetical protein